MKVAVGISGGVDSAVAALLLKEQGHDLVGVTMALGRANEAQSVAEARSVADRLGIPFKVFDFAAAWNANILRYVRDTYLAGRTPNPCVRCNETVKFGLLPQAAFYLGCDRFATGHYARIVLKHGDTKTRRDMGTGASFQIEGGAGERSAPLCLCVKNKMAETEPRLFRAVDKSKDQSYFLYRVRPEILARTIFPLGELTKDEVRTKARAFGFEVADRGDSQDFCGGDPMEIVNASDREGDVVTVDGKVIGRHRGYWHYTVGMRKGLGIGGGTPYYVIALDAARNRVIVGFKADAVRGEFALGEVVLTSGEDALTSGEDAASPLFVKVRSGGEPKGPVSVQGDRVQCPDGIAGIAPGQSAVFYRGDEVVGGGIIV